MKGLGGFKEFIRNPHWTLIVLPPLILIPIHLIAPVGGQFSCSQFSFGLGGPSIFLVALCFGAFNSIRRFLFHRRDKRLYRSLLTVVISLLLIFIESPQVGNMHRLIENLAKEVQADCIKHGKCPEYPIPSSLVFIALYSTTDNQSEFSIDYCYMEDHQIKWSGGVQNSLEKAVKNWN
jgi:hypothetical protein